MAPILTVEGVSKRFEKRLDAIGRVARCLGANVDDVVVHAVDRANLTVDEGEVVALVGESGCGKSTLGRMVAGISPPTEGRVLFEGRDIKALSGKAARDAQLAVQMIFQDPMSSLNPRMRVRDIIMQAPLHHGLVKKCEVGAALDETLKRVGLDPSYADRYPHQFSGGQRARIGIARALAVRPRMLVCDESVAALDVSIQAQILNLFLDLKDALRLTYLFISHDLGVVRHISDRVAVMYLGRIVEMAPAAEIFSRPNHPYTKALLAEAPRISNGRRQFAPISGEIPSPLQPPSGCHFHPRCPQAGPRCRTEAPNLTSIGAGHQSRCHLNDGGVEFADARGVITLKKPAVVANS